MVRWFNICNLVAQKHIWSLYYLYNKGSIDCKQNWSHEDTDKQIPILTQFTKTSYLRKKNDRFLPITRIDG